MMDIKTIIDGIELADMIIAAICGSAAVSEILPHLKKVKANSTFQLCLNVLRAISGVLTGNRRDKDKQYLE
jgi:hypothetical protein